MIDIHHFVNSDSRRGRLTRRRAPVSRWRLLHAVLRRVERIDDRAKDRLLVAVAGVRHRVHSARGKPRCARSPPATPCPGPGTGVRHRLPDREDPTPPARTIRKINELLRSNDQSNTPTDPAGGPENSAVLVGILAR